MSTNTYRDGVPYWAELDSPDPEATARFYGQLFGWQVREDPGEPGGYLAYLPGGRPVSAIKSAPAAGRGTWRIYIGVADAAATAAKVSAAGGSVLTLPDGAAASGRRAVFTDHSGTRFAVREPVGVIVPPGEPWAFARGELITDDVEASAAFYGAVFDWKTTGPEGPLGRREWQLDGRTISGLLPRPPAMPAEIPPYWDVYFTVTNPAATVAAVAQLGGNVLMPVTVTEHGTIAVFTDTAGAVFSVMVKAR
jgi:uncharacterized protein